MMSLVDALDVRSVSGSLCADVDDPQHASGAGWYTV